MTVLTVLKSFYLERIFAKSVLGHLKIGKPVLFMKNCPVLEMCTHLIAKPACLTRGANIGMPLPFPDSCIWKKIDLKGERQ